MALVNLGLTYTLLNKEIDLYSKTGIYYLNSEQYGDDVIVPENDPSNKFQSTFGIPYVDAADGDKISIGLFGKKGGMFLIYNHSNKKYKVFPKAVDDLYYILKLKGSNFIQEILNNKRIKKAANEFPNSRILNEVISIFERQRSI